MSSKALAEKYNLLPKQVNQDNYLRLVEQGKVQSPVRKVTSLITLAVDQNYLSSRSLQSLVSTFNPSTPFNRVLLYHGTGTGKTYKSLVLAAGYSRDVTVVIHHSIQKTVFEKCLSSDRFRKTCPTFENKVSYVTTKGVQEAYFKKDFARLRRLFEGTVVILDEAHRSKGGEGSVSTTLDSLLTVLTEYNVVAFIALTATPLVDSELETITLGSLIKVDKRSEANPYLATESLKGYISSLHLKLANYTETLVPCPVLPGSPQEQAYKSADLRRAVYVDLTEICYFSPNYIGNICARDLSVLQISRTLGISPREVVKAFSAKLDVLIEMLLGEDVKWKHLRNTCKLIPVSWKKRGGLLRILDVLTTCTPFKLVTKVSDLEDQTAPRRLLSIPHVPPSELGGLLAACNSPDNLEGKLIEVVLVTPASFQSISLNLVRTVLLVNIYWNETIKKQILGRTGRRGGSQGEIPLIRVYRLVLYVDGSPSLEEDIHITSKNKYKQILPHLKMMKQSSIEKYYNPNLESQHQPHNYTAQSSWGFVDPNYLPVLNYRLQITNITDFIEYINQPGTLIDLLYKQYINSSKAHSTVTQAFEEAYIKSNIRKCDVTRGEKVLLEELSASLIKAGDNTYHILYIASSDTVEYQRFARRERRVVRWLNGDHWTDCNDPRTTSLVIEQYSSLQQKFEERTKEIRKGLDYYMFITYLPPAFRLVYCPVVEGPDGELISDPSKVSRGRKIISTEMIHYWTLAAKLLKCSIEQLQRYVQNIIKRNPRRAKSVGQRVNYSAKYLLFQIILINFEKLGLVLKLPV